MIENKEVPMMAMTHLAMQLGLVINNCTKKAYEKIMYRNGKLINGVYVKEEDFHAKNDSKTV